MEQSRFSGVIIRVSNLDICRAFYRDVLGLGAPVMDSNFWVEFRVSSVMSLFLEKTERDEKIAPPNERVAWLLQVPNLTEFAQKMEKYGYQKETASADRVGFPVRVYKDPEGNEFFVSEMK